MAGATKTVKIRFDGDATGFTFVTKEVEKSTNNLKDHLNKFSEGMGKFAANAGKLANNLSTVSTVLNTVGSVGPSLVAASGALLALPAAGVAAAGVMAAVKLGADGAKKAFEGLSKSVDPLKAAVSKSFESSLNPAVDNLNKILPKLKTPFQAIVTSLGGMATGATRVAALPGNMSILNTVMMGTARLMSNLQKAVPALTQVFFDLVSVAAPGIGNIGKNAGTAAQHFADLIHRMKESGQLKDIFDKGIETIKGFGAMLNDILGIIRGVFRGISDGAGGVGGVMAPVLDMLNRFINSTQGQLVLQSIGKSLKAIGDAFSKVLGPALLAIAPLIPPLLDLFSRVITALADGLLPVITFLAPGLAAIAHWISENTSWLGPLAVAIGVATAAMWLLNVAMNANPIILIISLIVLLVAAFVSLWQKSEAFRNFFIGAWDAIKGAVGTAISWIGDRWHDLVQAFENTVSWFKRIGTSIGNGISDGIKSGINWVIGAINGFLHGLNWVIDGLNNIPGVSLGHIPDIPRLARGGTLDQGGLAMVGEQGRELVSLPGGASVSSHAQTEALMGGGGPVEVRVFIGERELTDMVRVEINNANAETKRKVLQGVAR